MDKSAAEELQQRVERARRSRDFLLESNAANIVEATRLFATLHAKFADLAESDQFRFLKIRLHDSFVTFWFGDDNDDVVQTKLWQVCPIMRPKSSPEELGFRVKEVTFLGDVDGEPKNREWTETFPDAETTWNHVLDIIANQMVWREKPET